MCVFNTRTGELVTTTGKDDIMANIAARADPWDAVDAWVAQVGHGTCLGYSMALSGVLSVVGVGMLLHSSSSDSAAGWEC